MYINITIGIWLFFIGVLLALIIREIWLRKKFFKVTEDTVSSTEELNTVLISKRSDTLPKNYLAGDKISNLPDNLKVYVAPWAVKINRNYCGYIDSGFSYTTTPIGTSELPIMKIDNTIVVYLSEMKSGYKWDIGCWGKPGDLNVIFDEKAS